jgi:DNA-binding response OmpR family regulator
MTMTTPRSELRPDGAPRSREDPAEAAPAYGAALVAGPDGPLTDVLVPDLIRLGYAPAVVPLSTAPDEAGPVGLVLVASSPADEEAVRFARQVRRSATFHGTPLIWVTGEREAADLARGEDLYDDFLEAPYSQAGLEARLGLARRRVGQEDSQVLRRGSLVLNLSTYQASVAGSALALTFMEHQLLRFLAASPGRVHTREVILQSVWGYDYYGGIRTVDVHVRRLRAKLGQEHARLIETVRSVGYRFAVDAR